MLERLSKARGIWCALPLLVSASHPVAAHSPIQGLGVFYNAMLHPFLEPVHLLLLIGVGLLLGRQRRKMAGTGVAALLFGFVAALMSLRIGVPALERDAVLLALALTCGGLVAASPWRTPGLALLLATSSGLALGLSSAQNDVGMTAAALAAIGLTAGALAPVLLLAGLTVERSGPWFDIGVRIAAAWVVAIAILALSMFFSDHSGVRKATYRGDAVTELHTC